MKPLIRFFVQFNDGTYWKGQGAKTTPDLSAAAFLRECDISDQRENDDRLRRVNCVRETSNRYNKKKLELVSSYRIGTVSIDIAQVPDAWTYSTVKIKRTCKTCACAHKVTYTRWDASQRCDVEVSVHECWGVQEPFLLEDFENRVCSLNPLHT